LAASPASLNLVHAVSLPSLLAFERSQPENQEGTMLRLFVVASLLAIGLVIPAAAELISEHDARQAGETIVQAYNKAGRAKDAAGLAAVYAENAILVMPDGPLVGRAAIEKYFSNAFKVFTLEAAQLDRVSMIADGQVMLRNGSFTGTVQGPNGVSPVKGYWATTDVREGGAWKIRLEEDNMTTLPTSSEQKR
jgi:uncharacterized protein (TIGR02246 family)